MDALPKNIKSAYHNIDSMTKFKADYVEFQGYLQRSISSHCQHSTRERAKSYLEDETNFENQQARPGCP